MLLTKFAVVAVLLASTVLANPEAPVKIRFRMKGGVKRDASHIANYYLPAATTYQHQPQYQYQPQAQYQHQAGGLGGSQHLQVLDVKIPQSQGHYIPSYALPSKSYESNAHHFHGHTPQFTHTGQQYVLSSGHGGSFEELAKALGSQGASSASASSSSGHAAFGGASSFGHGYAASASPSYSYSSQSFGHQAAQQAAPISAHGGYSFASLPQTTATETTKTGPISFGEQSTGQIQQQVQHQQQQIQIQAPSYGGHQFGFVAGSGHEQQQQAAPQITYIPQAQALTSAGHGASHGQTQNTPVYAVGMKGLGHYATGNYFGHGGHGASSSSLSSHGQGLSLGHSLGGLSFGSGSHGQYILDTSALKGLNLGGSKFIVMSKPTAVTYGHHHSYPTQHYPRYTSPTASYSAASLSSAGGYKSAAPFKPSVFLGATQESVAEYQHGSYGQEATASTGYSSGGEYKFVGPTAATSYATTSGHGH